MCASLFSSNLCRMLHFNASDQTLVSSHSSTFTSKNQLLFWLRRFPDYLKWEEIRKNREQILVEKRPRKRNIGGKKFSKKQDWP